MRRLQPMGKFGVPWNIASDFKVKMSFDTADIAGMLREYEADHNTGMNVTAVAQAIEDFTSGYPFLVSRICQLIDTELIWRGNAYNERGEDQLSAYLDYYHIDKGYMLSYNFNQKRPSACMPFRWERRRLLRRWFERQKEQSPKPNKKSAQIMQYLADFCLLSTKNGLSSAARQLRSDWIRTSGLLVPKGWGGRFSFIYKAFRAFRLGIRWCVNISCRYISGCYGARYGSAWGHEFWVRFPV